jgi:hypothetical protein
MSRSASGGGGSSAEPHGSRSRGTDAAKLAAIMVQSVGATAD